MNCVRCNALLTYDEGGLNRKFNAGEGALCMHCLALKLHVSEKRLQEKIIEFQKAGCLYFSRSDSTES